MAGWTTYFLGPDTPVAEIADAARRLGVGRGRDELVDALPPARRASRRGRAQEGTARRGHLGGRPRLRGSRHRVAAAGGRGPGRAARGSPGRAPERRRTRRRTMATEGPEPCSACASPRGSCARVPVQSILIAAGIAVGIGVQVFLGSLITSLQTSLVDQTIGNSPQVVVQAKQDGQPVTYTPQLKQAMEAQSEITTVVPTRAYSAHLPQRAARARRSSSPAARSTSSTPSTTSPAGSSPARRRSAAGEVIVGKDFADKFGLKPGDQATFVLPSRRARRSSPSPASSTSARRRPTAPRRS